METRRSNRILALCLLALLGIGAAGAMTWYIIAGHNWNKAANHIDDLVGSMEDYTVVLMEGTKAPAAHLPKGASGEAAKDSGEKPPTIGQIEVSYREKTATVLVVNTHDLSRYEDPVIVARDGRRYGICAALGEYRYVDVRDKVAWLKKHLCDFVIVIADQPDIKYGWLRDVDLVMLACNGHLPADGEYIDSAFFVDSPYKGETRAVIVSPSGTMTTKVITEL